MARSDCSSLPFLCTNSNALQVNINSLSNPVFVSTGTNGLPHASATPPAYVYIDNLCNRLGVIIGNHILDIINEGLEY